MKWLTTPLVGVESYTLDPPYLSIIMGNRVDITGKKYGRLTVIEFSHTDKHRYSHWLCKCDCGNEKIINGVSLKSGNTKSCGCIRRPDLTGQKFGKLTVIKLSSIIKNNSSCWLCKCDCGNEKIINSGSLKSGLTKSCGCARRPNLIEQRFGKLTVIKFSHVDKLGHLYWLCKCDCGKKKAIRGTSLQNGNTKSCGCLSKLPEGVAACSAILISHKKHAKKRNLEQSLTDKQIIALHKENCYYCKFPPSNISFSSNGSYIYNGIDRRDNNKGYTIDNSVSCCGYCNRAKGIKSEEEYINWLNFIRQT